MAKPKRHMDVPQGACFGRGNRDGLSCTNGKSQK